MLKPFGEGMHCALPLCLIQLGVLLHQEDARARFLYKVKIMPLTRVVGMLVEQLEPAIGDGNALLLGVVLAHLEALAGGRVDDVLHVLLSQRAQDAKEELALRQLVGELLLCGQVLSEHGVLHGVLVEVLHRKLLVAGDVEADDLVLLEVQLLVGQNVSHEAEFGSLHRRQEHVHYDNDVMKLQALPCWVI
jgi:hypothetical protein